MYPLIKLELAKMQNVPKNLWESTVMRKHPEILELRERVRSIPNFTSYGRQIASGKTEAKTAVNSEAVLQVDSKI